MTQWDEALVEIQKIVGNTLEFIMTRGYKQRKCYGAPYQPLALRILDEIGVEYILLWTKDPAKLCQNPFLKFHLIPQVLGRTLSYDGYAENTIRNIGTYKSLNSNYHVFLKNLADAFGYSLVVELDLSEEIRNEVFTGHRNYRPWGKKITPTVSTPKPTPVSIIVEEEPHVPILVTPEPWPSHHLENKSLGAFADLPVTVTKLLWRMARTGRDLSAIDQHQLLTLFTTGYTEEQLNSFDVTI